MKSSVPIKEVELQFNSGFLTEYWESRKELPSESGISFYSNSIYRIWNVLASEPLSTLSSYIIISASLFMLSLFLLFDYNIGRLLSQVGPSNEGMVYFKSTASEGDIHSVHKMLGESSFFQSTKYVSKTDALDLFKKDFGDDSMILKGLDDNPLPDAIEFRINDNHNPDLSLQEIKNMIGELEAVDEITLGAPWADTAERFRAGLQKMSLAVFLIVLAVMIFIVANAVKLMLLSQKEEIEIMQLVGAPRRLVMIPYIGSGMIQGLFGAVTALLITYVLYIFFLIPLNSFLIIGVSYEVFSFLDFWFLSLVVFLGVLLGFIGSYVAIRRWT